MLQANPALTPNAVKAILQYTSQEYAGYNALTQGAGFLNARGAVELARFFAAPLTIPYPTSTANWSRQLLWGNHRVQGGRLTPTANAWGTDVTWGAAAAFDGQAVTWGVLCSSPDCSGATPDRWGAACVTVDCRVVVWGSVTSENVVWGWTCGGADCDAARSVPLLLSLTPGTPGLVWSSATEDTVVWGTADNGDTVVWGTADDGDTVVWGTSGDSSVIWDTSCEEPDFTSVI
jgi:hypothetical protein